MSSIRLGDAIFNNMEDNEYLIEIYESLLFNYAITKNCLTPNLELKAINIKDALRFADILSKSTHKEKSVYHRMWAQEIVLLLNLLFPKNHEIKCFMASILETIGNYRGLSTKKMKYNSIDAFDLLYNSIKKEDLKIPDRENEYFFPVQKDIYENLDEKCFSYSGPTSLGKSFLIQVFIKQKIKNENCLNYAVLVPSRALISEVRDEFLSSLQNLLIEKNYRIITSSSDILLQGDHNFIFILTPERLVSLLSIYLKLKIDFVFIDEAHKISNKDQRSIYYYECISYLKNRIGESSFIFASPNIPNPDVYFGLFYESPERQVTLQTAYSPVSQFKYLIDIENKKFFFFNERSKEIKELWTTDTELSLTKLIQTVGKDQQNLVYVNSQVRLLQYADDFAENLPEKNNVKLKKLSEYIKEEINPDCFLSVLVLKGVAYHAGYLPHNIKTRIEKYYKEGLIRTIFCTSTLNEGVNLPADNLFITDFTNGRKDLTEVEFKNLVGRVGRIRKNLYGNAFLICMPEKKKAFAKYSTLLSSHIPQQKLSIEQQLTPRQKKAIIESLANGDIEMRNSLEKETINDYSIMRTIALSLARTINLNSTSAIKRIFETFLNPENIERIKDNFSKEKIVTDISISWDQTENLKTAIFSGLKYPALTENYQQNRAEIKEFLKKISDIFKWPVYEKKYLGNLDDTETYWFAVILEKWMTGQPLKEIVRIALTFAAKYPFDGVKIGNNKIANTFNPNNYTHRNSIIVDALQRLENTVRFSIANYFRAFSSAYREIHPNEEFNADWYEFVEYGSMDPTVKMLQQLGFSRSSSLYIVKNQDEYLDYNYIEPKIKGALMNCPEEIIRSEARVLSYNIAEYIVE